MNRWPLNNLVKENTSWTYLTDIFSDGDIDRIVALGEELNTITGTVGAGVIDPYRTCKLSWFDPDDFELDWVYETLSTAIQTINQQHFNFDITHIMPMQFTRYDSSDAGHYSPHADHGPKAPFRKLSFSLQLTDPSEYTGGDLQFLHNKSEPEIAPKEKGTIIFFPSYAVHEVTPITSGTRHSLVGWVAGPNFK